MVLLLLVAVPSCTGRNAPPSEKISSAYADLLLLRSMKGTIDSTRYAVAVDSVLASHDLDRSSFEAGMISIGGTPEEVNAFFDRVNDRLNPPADSADSTNEAHPD
jgi:hypothetical protein